VAEISMISVAAPFATCRRVSCYCAAPVLRSEVCVEAHLAQADQRLTQAKEAGARWSSLEAVVEARGWPGRLVIALEQSLMGRTDRASYGREAGISVATASTDFRRLLDAGLVEQEGRGRNIGYRASEALRTELPRSK
jgi:Fic family protein